MSSASSNNITTYEFSPFDNGRYEAAIGGNNLLLEFDRKWLGHQFSSYKNALKESFFEKFRTNEKMEDLFMMGVLNTNEGSTTFTEEGCAVFYNAVNDSTKKSVPNGMRNWMLRRDEVSPDGTISSTSISSWYHGSSKSSDKKTAPGFSSGDYMKRVFPNVNANPYDYLDNK